MHGRRQVWPPNSMPKGPPASGGRIPPPCRPRGGSGLTKTECGLTPLCCRRRYLLLQCTAGPLIFCRSWIIRRPRGRTQPRVLARIVDGARWSWKDLFALSELEITPLQPRSTVVGLLRLALDRGIFVTHHEGALGWPAGWPLLAYGKEGLRLQQVLHIRRRRRWRRRMQRWAS